MPLDEDTTAMMLQRSMERPNTARMYDYYLGGTYNFEKDREQAERVKQILPRITALAQLNRQFLHRAVRAAIDAGIYQFIDVGAGLPTQDAVHHQCDEYAKNMCRVLYVDNDPIAAAHSQYLLEEGGDGFGAVGGVPRFASACENFYDPAAILRAAESRAHIDLTKPVCVLMLLLLHFMEHPEGALRSYREKLAPGSLLAISHACNDNRDDSLEAARATYDQSNSAILWRSGGQIASLFGEWPLIDPGKVVWAPEWRPNGEVELAEEPWESAIKCGIAEKPAS